MTRPPDPFDAAVERYRARFGGAALPVLPNVASAGGHGGSASAREAVRRVLARAELQRRFGGRDAPPPVARRVLRLLP